MRNVTSLGDMLSTRRVVVVGMAMALVIMGMAGGVIGESKIVLDNSGLVLSSGIDKGDGGNGLSGEGSEDGEGERESNNGGEWAENNKAQKVKVGLYLLNLGRFDVSSGSFTADFYLSFRCDEPCEPKFEFMNGRAASLEKIVEMPEEKFYRVQANLNSQVDLKRFPFDSQRLVIAIEDKEKASEKLVFVPESNQSGIDPSITFVGWRLDGFKIDVKEHAYEVYGESYSQYEYSIDISRIEWNSFLKTFLPVIFIVLIVLFSFVLDPDKISTRLTMASSSLVASVMFHISITNQIPPVGYLTFADKFMGLTYLVLLLSFIINITLLELQERKKAELVERIHRQTEFAMFAIVPILYVLLFVLVS